MNILPYLIIVVFAAVEGEVVYSSAVVGVFLGRLNAVGVLLSGSIGGWAGDQFFFYAARGPLSNWINGFTTIARRASLCVIVSMFLPQPPGAKEPFKNGCEGTPTSSF